MQTVCEWAIMHDFIFLFILFFCYFCSFSDGIIQLNPEKDNIQYILKKQFFKLVMLLTFSAMEFLQLQPSQLDMDYFSLVFCTLTNSLPIGISTGLEGRNVIVKLKAILSVGENDYHIFV